MWPGVLRWLKRIGLGIVALVAVAVIFGSGYEFFARQRAHSTYPPPGQMLDIGGRKMHLDCRGTGLPTVILESGLDTDGSLSWDKVQDPLARLTRTCSYDRAGVMWSEPKAGPQDADGVVADLHATLVAAGITGPLVLVCHSLGGPYIMNYTKKYGDEVKGLVFVDCSHPDQLSKLPPKIAATKTPFLYRVLSALSWTGISRLMPEPAVPGMPERIKPIGMAYLGESLGGSLKEMDGIETTFRQSGELRSLGDRPLVVLTAMQPIPEDMLTPMDLTAQDALDMQAVWKELSADEASWSAQSRLELVPDSQHYIQFQRPDLVIQAVTEVVNSVRAEEQLVRFRP